MDLVGGMPGNYLVVAFHAPTWCNGDKVYVPGYMLLGKELKVGPLRVDLTGTNRCLAHIVLLAEVLDRYGGSSPLTLYTRPSHVVRSILNTRFEHVKRMPEMELICSHVDKALAAGGHSLLFATKGTPPYRIWKHAVEEIKLTLGR